MKLFGVIVLAAILSCFSGLAVTILLNQLIACRSDPAGCGLAQAYTVLAVPLEAVLVLIVFGIAVVFRNRLRAIAIVAIGLCVLAFSMIAVGLSSDMSSGRATKPDDILELLQLIVPFCVVVVTQWFLIRTYLLRRQAAEAAA
jgi:hypothetical protein